MTQFKSVPQKSVHHAGLVVPTASGLHVNLIAPEPGSFRITDICAGLGNTCRYAGQLDQFYSVAQHSVIVSRITAPRLAPYGLLHDAAEAYMHDLGPAVKELVGSQYRPVEDRLQDAIYAAFGLPALNVADKAHIKWADKRAAAAEMRHFRFNCVEPLACASDLDADEPIIPLDPRPAKALFMDRFNELFS